MKSLLLQRVCTVFLIGVILVNASGCGQSGVKPAATVQPEVASALQKEQPEKVNNLPPQTTSKGQVATEKNEVPKEEVIKEEVIHEEVPQKEKQKKPLVKKELVKTQKTPLEPVPKKEVTSPPKVEVVEKVAMPSENYTDGSYFGEGEGKKGPVKVEVTIKNNRIADIKVLEHGESEGIAEMAFNTVKEVILKQQSVSVEGMSGATKSSQGLKDAVKAALSLSIK